MQDWGIQSMRWPKWLHFSSAVEQNYGLFQTGFVTSIPGSFCPQLFKADYFCLFWPGHHTLTPGGRPCESEFRWEVQRTDTCMSGFSYGVFTIRYLLPCVKKSHLPIPQEGFRDSRAWSLVLAACLLATRPIAVGGALFGNCTGQHTWSRFCVVVILTVKSWH